VVVEAMLAERDPFGDDCRDRGFESRRYGAADDAIDARSDTDTW
jgi:hypothetical protein